MYIYISKYRAIVDLEFVSLDPGRSTLRHHIILNFQYFFMQFFLEKVSYVKYTQNHFLGILGTGKLFSLNLNLAS